VNATDNLGVRQAQNVHIAAQFAWAILELRAAEARLVQFVPLDHCAHGAVQYQDPILDGATERGDTLLPRGAKIDRGCVHGTTAA